ncbi:MAG: bifunctional DNA primase/polymerase [Maritimibacter sp.]|nr:bifunctional DNA primase/polymerase [Maritimibacter sp.]
MSPRNSLQFAQWARIEEEMFRLHDCGFSLLPIGGGDDGKSPLLKYKDIPRLPLQQVIAPMARAGSLMFAIRLGGLAVLDIDEFDDDLLIELTDRFGPARVQVRTARGIHLYFKAPVGKLPNLRKEGLPVDVKSGPNAYVVGPGSIRPTGEEYYYSSQARLGEIELTKLQFGPAIVSPIAPAPAVPPTPPAAKNSHRSEVKIQIGARNKYLTAKAIELVPHSADVWELLEQMRVERDARCESPETVSDTELTKLAEWAWQKRLDNSLFEGRASSFRFNRSALDCLRGTPGWSDALTLYTVLLDQHSGEPAKTFTLVYKSMRDANWTELSRDRFRAARKLLEDKGLLEKVAGHLPNKRHARFRLVRPVPDGIVRLST